MIPKLLRPSASLVAGVAAVVAVPVVLPVLGLGVGSLAVKGTSLSATTRYGMPVVSCLQSVGAAETTLSQSVTVAGTTTGVTSGFQAAVGRLLGRERHNAGGFQGNTAGARGKATDKRESPPLPQPRPEFKPSPAQGTQPGQNEPETDGRAAQLRRILVPVAVGVIVVVAVPHVVAGLGFGAGGIAAGSLAAKGMSLAAITGYGMVVVSCLQSVGAAGMTFPQGVTVGTAAAGMVAGAQAGVGRLPGRGQE